MPKLLFKGDGHNFLVLIHHVKHRYLYLAITYWIVILIGISILPSEAKANSSFYAVSKVSGSDHLLKFGLESFEKKYFSDILDKTRGNISKADRKAVIDRKTVYRIMKKYGLNIM